MRWTCRAGVDGRGHPFWTPATNTHIYIVRSLLVMMLACVSLTTIAAEPYEKFYGHYEGEAVSETDGEIGKRDLEVKIEGREAGYNVTWVSVTRKSSGKIKRKEYSIDFLPSRREGLYRSAMRSGLFGQAVPLDPMQGDPYVWARIEGDTLTVYALIISEQGGYEMQVYDRSLTANGMDLKYSRVRDGEILRTVGGALKKR